MPQMTAVQISRPGEPFDVIAQEIAEPGPNAVRIKVHACGICHSDMFVKDGLWPGLQYPRIPGHEVAGVIDAVGPDVTTWQKGQRVGVGWHGGHCHQCVPCRQGDFMGWYCQLNENPTLNPPVAWRESIELSVITLCAPQVQSATFGLI